MPTSTRRARNVAEQSTPPVVLITGCSSGIGRDLALRLAESGYTVVATARSLEALDALPAAMKLPLDVTRQDLVDEAVGRTVERFGRIDALVNNAGISVLGAVEEISLERVHQVFDVNVYGVLRMIGAIAPYMRRQESGRIVNIGSITGKLALPVNGTYSATKFALEALTDAARIELAPFGIQVVLIEPGSIKTGFTDSAQRRAYAAFANPHSPYRTLYQRYQRMTPMMRRREPGPAVVSRVVQHAIEVTRPKARYLAGVPFGGRLVLLLRDVVWPVVLRSMFQVAVPGTAGRGLVAALRADFGKRRLR